MVGAIGHRLGLAPVGKHLRGGRDPGIIFGSGKGGGAAIRAGIIWAWPPSVPCLGRAAGSGGGAAAAAAAARAAGAQAGASAGPVPRSPIGVNGPPLVLHRQLAVGEEGRRWRQGIGDGVRGGVAPPMESAAGFGRRAARAVAAGPMGAKGASAVQRARSRWAERPGRAAPTRARPMDAEPAKRGAGPERRPGSRRRGSPGRCARMTDAIHPG